MSCIHCSRRPISCIKKWCFCAVLVQRCVHVQAIERAVAEEGWKVVLMLRLSPAFPFTAVNYAAGLTCISFWGFMGASAVGLIPGRTSFAMGFSSDVNNPLVPEAGRKCSTALHCAFGLRMPTTQWTVLECKDVLIESLLTPLLLCTTFPLLCTPGASHPTFGKRSMEPTTC